jgi:hypothetical protein
MNEEHNEHIYKKKKNDRSNRKGKNIITFIFTQSKKLNYLQEPHNCHSY